MPAAAGTIAYRSAVVMAVAVLMMPVAVLVILVMVK